MHPDTITIPLTHGKQTIIDAEDCERVSQFKWLAVWSGHKFYVARSVRADGKQGRVLLHRFLMDAPEGLEVDHINGDSLDNRRSTNLRLATRAQNCGNTRMHANNTSGFKGVKAMSPGRWSARIQVDGKPRHLGSFGTPEDAAYAYDNAARALFGEYARVNFPHILTTPVPILRQTKSPYRGVSFVSATGRWKAMIQHDGKRLFLGNFDSAEDAARAWDAKTRELFGVGMVTNF